ncbi:MAG: histidine kinase [Opitutaceae bacterium]|nr:histidine kinase [Opitutaceae bacterium]
MTHIAAAPPSAAAPQDYLVHVWQTDDGLPQNWVSSIAQTPEGYLWIGSRYGGLARFDGMRFVPFNPQNTRALEDVQIEHLSLDATGRLWIIMGNESVTTYQDGVFHLHRKPRTDPRMKLDHVIDTRGDGILFAGEWPFVAKARHTPAATEWTVIRPRFNMKVGSRTFSVDRNGVIWALTRDQKIVRRQGGRFGQLPGNLAPPGAAFVSIDSDRERTIWAATSNRLLRWEDERGFTDVTPRDAPEPEAIVEIAFSGDGGLWVLEKNRLRKFLKDRWVAEVDSPLLLRHTAAGTFSLHGDAQGNLWIVSYGRGLWHAKSDGAATLLDEQTGLPGMFVTCWFQDNEGNVWIGTTDGGIARIRENIFTTLGRAQGLPGKVVSSVCMDKQGKLWAGTMAGGLASWEGGRFKKQQLPIPDDGNPAASLSVFPSDDGGLWVGSINHGLMRMRDGKIRSLRNWENIRVIFGDSQGNTWISPLAGLDRIREDRVTRFDDKDGFVTSHAIGAMAEDAAGAIWIGTGPGDLWKFAGGKFTKYTPPPEWRAGRISAVLPDTGGVIWIGTLGGGLLRFHNGAFTRCTKTNGLPDNNVSQLLDSGDGHLWAGTYAGIFRASKDDLAKVAIKGEGDVSLRIYGRFDGLPALECSSGFQPACWRADDGALYFSTANGVVSVNPQKITENTIPPTVLIEELIVDGKRHGIPHVSARTIANTQRAPDIEIAPGQHHVQFQVTALNFAAPDGVRFRVKLHGAETEWRNVDSRRLIGYGPLLPGKYRFHVIACNNDGVWNEAGDFLEFKVLPWFWETVWFKIILGIAVFATLVIIATRMQRQRYRRRIQDVERQRELERERTRIAQDLHDDLGTSLTQINLLSALASREQTPIGETRELIQQVDGCAREMVTALDEIVWAVNPKNDSWFELANYLGFFAEEFFQGTGMRCRLGIPEQIPHIPISSEVRHHLFLVVKEALNNAARHSRAEQVWLRIAADAREVAICVEDDGCGFHHPPAEPRHSGGNGMNNMRHRMAQVGGSVEIRGGPGGRGTAMIFRIPLVRERQDAATA